jgi:hypothetical protein
MGNCRHPVNLFPSIFSNCKPQVNFFGSIFSNCMPPVNFFASIFSNCRPQVNFFVSIFSNCTPQVNFFGSIFSNCTPPVNFQHQILSSLHQFLNSSWRKDSTAKSTPTIHFVSTIYYPSLHILSRPSPTIINLYTQKKMSNKNVKIVKIFL